MLQHLNTPHINERVRGDCVCVVCVCEVDARKREDFVRIVWRLYNEMIAMGSQLCACSGV